MTRLNRSIYDSLFIKKMLIVLLSLFFHQGVIAQNIYFKHYTAQDGLSHNIAYDLMQDDDHYLWIATVDGLSRFNGLNFQNYSIEDGLLNNSVKRISKNNNQLLFHFDDDTYQYIEKDQFYTVQDTVKLSASFFSKTRSASLPKEYTLDTIQNKLYWHTSEGNYTDLLTELNIKSRLTAVYLDHEKHLWLTTEGDGIYMIYRSSFTNYGVENGLENTFVNDISQTPDGQIWAGTKDGFYQFRAHQWYKEELIESIEVSQFQQSENTGLYASTNAGIFKINDPLENCIPTETTTTSFIIDLFGRINLLRGGYFWVYQNCDTSAMKWIAEIENLSSEYCLFKDHKDRFWVGTGQGVFIYDDFKFRQLSKKNGLPSNIINHIIQDENKNNWLATEKGLVQLKNDTIIRIYNTKDGLLSNQCRKLCIDPRGGIWIATPRGLHYLNNGNIIPYNEQTGLSTSDVNALFIDQKQQLWVATSNGIAATFLEDLPQKATPPQVELTQVLLNGEIIKSDQLKQLPYDAYLQFSYESITFLNASQMIFEYRLNENEPWLRTNSRSLSFNNLQSGRYNFQIRAKKINSDWSEVKGLSFKITPPFWRAWWFFMFLILAIIGISVVIIWIIRQRESQKTAFNKQLAQLELNALQSQMNPHFIFNALNAIQDYIVRHDAIAANKYLSQFAKLMRLFLESSSSKFISLSEEIRLLKLYVSLEKICYEDKFDYQFEIEEELDEDLEIPAMFIQPFVENAIRHGLFHLDKKGFLTIKFSEEKESILCEIIDNGIGRAKAETIKKATRNQHQSKGMQLIEQRQAVFESLENEAIQIDIFDLKNEHNEPTGTKIRILMKYT